MSFTKKLSLGTAAIALLAAAPAAVYAQETTGSISGSVSSSDGSSMAGASVTVQHVPTGSVRTATVGSTGSFAADNLRPGGPYIVTVSAPGYAGQRVEGVYVELGAATDLNLRLDSASADVIVVTASAINAVEVAVGPSAVFTQQDLERLPSVNRTINDIIRTDPRIYVDEADVDGIQCAGANSRFNSLTLDGVRINDGFGLNRNGFPTERQPFPFDALSQVAVELAPFDVFYGGFSACNINTVTKSGGNEFHGGAFYDYTSDSMQGDSLEGSGVQAPEFDEQRYGFHVGGPIIEDRLFFFVNYEHLEGANTFTRGVEGSGALNEVAGFTQAEFDEILDIARTVYNYDPGFAPTSFPNEDDKLLVRFDWEINNQHRADFVYLYNDGFNITASDGDPNEFEFSNHLYQRGAELNRYVGSLYSDWTDNFSTEVRIGFTDLVNTQDSIGNDGFGEMRITDSNTVAIDGTGQRNTIYIGEDDSRQSNELNYTVFNVTARGTYTWNDHTFSFGYEREETEIFNLFVQHTIGQYDFDSIADFRNGIPDDIDYNNAPSLNPADAAADWSYASNALYAQDEWDLGNGVVITAGLRYDFYTSDDSPAENANFLASYGYSNAQSMDGRDLLQPRVGVQWDVNDDLSLRGGFGLFSGGDPNVWLSNTYSTDFISQFGVNEGLFYGAGFTTLFDAGIVYPDGAGPGYSVPSQLIDAVAAGNGSPGFEMNNLDPNFEIPGEWKVSIGGTYDLYVPMDNFLGGDYRINADLLWSQDHNAAIITRRDLVETGTGPAGFPLYSSVNSPGTLELTNTDVNAESINFAFTIAKDYDFGLNWVFGYAYNDAEDVQPMTSSVAFSNYTSRAFVGANDEVASLSNYNIENRFTLNVNYEHEFVQDYATRFSLFAMATSGRPFSYTMNANGGGDLTNFNPFLSGDNWLLYVPTGPSDPNVDLSAMSAAEVTAFFDFINEAGLSGNAGGFADRNGDQGGWWTKADLRIAQDMPGFMEGHRSQIFLDIDNFTNLLNDEWGILNEAGFPRRNRVVDAELTNGSTQFAYSNFNNPTTTTRVGDASLWSVRVGLRYNF
ncbi:TonB-dependent receptor [Maricaulis sp.]|uniref:TonB-dependent receptor n=1 Tax=Maricaulis sp. TaxID=1486257 RepID=UPI003A90EC52